MTKRKIIEIDEDKCTGCGLCVPDCAEGALQIVDGKAKLVKDIYCDGLGACLGACPEDALHIIEREAEAFDEEATEKHLESLKKKDETNVSCPPHACPGSRVLQFDKPTESYGNQPSTLAQWPVQLHLVPVNAPFFQDSDLLIVADCVPFAYGNFHGEILKGRPIVIGCPKLDDSQAYVEKLAEIFKQNEIKSLTIVHMEVPCCSGLVHIAEEALKASGKDIPKKDVTIGVRGNIII
jgi:NAD-dependent dihydropyrimidine dehydrogenase PreA subunit